MAGIEYLFMYLFIIDVSSPVIYLFTYFAQI